MSHTPGPWVVCVADDDQIANTVFAESQLVDECIEAAAWDDCIATAGLNHANYEANATLIAEAPNLLKTLQDIAEQLEAHPAYIKGATQEDMEEQGGEAADITWMAQLARAAIAKAVLP